MTTQAPPASGLVPIPLNRASLAGAEIDYVGASLESGHMSSSGPFAKLAGEALRQETGAAEEMRSVGISPTFYHVPLHSSDAGVRFAAKPSECPVSEDVSGRLMRLRFFNNLSPEESDRVVAAFLGALKATT